ncbi:MAG: uridine monophosphate synthetase [Chlamydiales bacterium]|jgi:uridine monophosphate synthetase
MNEQELMLGLHDVKAVKFGSFTLKTGIISPIYLDLRVIVSHPRLLKAVAKAMWEKVHGVSFDVLCGVPYTALPISTCISLEHEIPMLMRRKEVKGYGTKKMIEGSFEKGQKCLIVEDLVTSGSSALETVFGLRTEGLEINDCVVLFDREQGGKENLSDQNVTLHAVFTLTQMLETLHDSKKIEASMVEAVLEFVRGAQTKGLVNVS